jgi:hypothetical protein
MRRAEVRQLKRAASRQHDAEAMAALLQRSVHFGHKRLVLLRCIQAEKMGISVAPDILSYCQQVASRMAPEELHKLLRQVSGHAMASSANAAC